MPSIYEIVAVKRQSNGGVAIGDGVLGSTPPANGVLLQGDIIIQDGARSYWGSASPFSAKRNTDSLWEFEHSVSGVVLDWLSSGGVPVTEWRMWQSIASNDAAQAPVLNLYNRKAGEVSIRFSRATDDTGSGALTVVGAPLFHIPPSLVHFHFGLALDSVVNVFMVDESGRIGFFGLGNTDHPSGLMQLSGTIPSGLDGVGFNFNPTHKPAGARDNMTIQITPTLDTSDAGYNALNSVLGMYIQAPVRAAGAGNVNMAAGIRFADFTTAWATTPRAIVFDAVGIANALSWPSAEVYQDVANRLRMDVTTFYLNGELIRGGLVRTTAQFDKTSDVTLADVPGLSVNVAAAGVYAFRAILHTSMIAAGGAKVAINGTATATSVVYNGYYLDSASANVMNGARRTTLGLATVSGAVVMTMIIVEGEIVVNAAGTLTVQFAQAAVDGTASSVLVGSVFDVKRIA